MTSHVGWRSLAMKRLVRRIEAGTSVNAFDVPAQAGEIGVLKTSCVYAGRFDPRENKRVVDGELDRVSCPVQGGTLIVSRMNTPDLVGSAGAVLNAAPQLFLPDRLWQIHFNGLNPRFAEYWCSTEMYRRQVRAACAGTSSSMQNLGQEDFLDFEIDCPPVAVQSEIVRLLDRETARIDALIGKKTKFIELLREKRQALITQAVTSGFQSDLARRDTGVVGLQAIPTHWAITKIKRLIKSISQGWSPECEARPPQEDEWAVLKVGCVNGGVFRPLESKALPTALPPRPELAVSRGDVLVSRANTRELVGSCALVTDDFPKLMLCDKLYRLIAADDVDPAYLAYVITVHCRRQIEIEANGASASMVNIAQEVILDVEVPRPPLTEQKAIVEKLEQSTARLDKLIDVCARSIGLLSERRAALITAAVTGQIDVRHEVHQDAMEPA